MRQGYCYTCLAIGGGISVGSLRVTVSGSRKRLFSDPEECFETVSDTFSTPGPEGPGDSLGDFLGFQAGRPERLL